MARGLATREASSQAQQWLSRFGTARVQIDVDDKFSLKNSQVELLAPLHDTPEQLLFTQGSVHRKDDRQQTTLGLACAVSTTATCSAPIAFWTTTCPANTPVWAWGSSTGATFSKSTPTATPV
jgi:hypothetical protein